MGCIGLGIVGAATFGLTVTDLFRLFLFCIDTFMVVGISMLWRPREEQGPVNGFCIFVSLMGLTDWTFFVPCILLLPFHFSSDFLSKESYIAYSYKNGDKW